MKVEIDECGLTSDKKWCLVPVEPTPEMIQAWIGYYGGDLGEGFSHQARAVWEAMLAAAPLPEDTHHG